MIYGLILTARARADILRNAQWWAENHTPNQAILWFDAIYQQLENLRMMPDRFPLAPENGLVDVEIEKCHLALVVVQAIAPYDKTA